MKARKRKNVAKRLTKQDNTFSKNVRGYHLYYAGLAFVNNLPSCGEE